MPRQSQFHFCCRLSLSLILLLGTAISAGDAPAPKDKFLLFILAGQSNMAGRGEVGEQDRVPHPRVFMLDKSLKWVPAADPLHFDKPSVVGTGLGKTFAVKIVEKFPDITIGLIPCAVGGSPIASWEPGGYHDQTKSHPWDDCAERMKVALPFGIPAGVLWHQGESDASPELAARYEGKLVELIARFRSEVHSPELPFLIGQLGKFEGIEWTDSQIQVDAAHRSVAERDPRVEFVSANGLKHKGDRVHFDAASYRTLGERYAEAYLRLMQQVGRSPR